jgi:hypothetical protein
MCVTKEKASRLADKSLIIVEDCFQERTLKIN